jgi:hypothetical protein
MPSSMVVTKNVNNGRADGWSHHKVVEIVTPAGPGPDIETFDILVRMSQPARCKEARRSTRYLILHLNSKEPIEGLSIITQEQLNDNKPQTLNSMLKYNAFFLCESVACLFHDYTRPPKQSCKYCGRQMIVVSSSP